ncbi:Serine/threonine protein kinase [Micromonospora citrea]|uniref:Serine/threonine protein kinase n=1 Tax=Micromonospora citrea TaxID=47855 RepID=A0A1C6W1V8_9ACTN|nr:serine/threonine-protein kinase [Micromonospora citrea]SCL72553.1 Serine/threonine protein kinase [Micromonospora citrea]
MWDLGPSDPRLVGPYRTRAVLGEGGMGRVLLATTTDGRLAAVKLVRGAFAADDDSFRQRLHREALAARRVDSPHTARVIGADATAGVPWLAYEFHHGPTLGQALQAAGPLDTDTVLHLAAGLATALRDIHAHNFIHRDLSASNVLLTDDGPIVIDFGIARPTGLPDDTTDTRIATVTQTGMIIGNPGFMSPEQAMGATQLTPASDIFALGTVLVLAATGHNPFQGATSEQTRLNIMTKEPDLDRVPPRLRHIVEPCLTRDPTQRPDAPTLLTTLGPPPHPHHPWPDPIAQLTETQQAEIRRYTQPAPTKILPGPRDLNPTKIFTRWRGSAAVQRDAPVAVESIVEPAADVSIRRPRLDRRATSLLALALACVAALVVAVPWAIGGDDATPDGSPEAADTFSARIEHSYGTTVIKTRPKRVATWGWGATEAAIALGTFPVGVAGKGSGRGLMPWVADAYRAKGVGLPVVFDPDSAAGKVPYEQIFSTAPDLILAPYSGLSREQYDKLSAVAPVVARPDSVDMWEGVVAVTAAALGLEGRGREILADADAYLSALGKQHELTGLTFAAIVHNRLEREVTVFSETSPPVRVLERLGMKLAGSVADLAPTGGDVMYDLDYEDLDKLDCDIVVVYSNSREMADRDLANKDLKALPAFAAGRIAQVADADGWDALASPTVLSIRSPAGMAKLARSLAQATPK